MTQDVSAVNPGWQMKWGHLRCKLPEVQVIVPTVSLGLKKFGGQVIVMIRSLVEAFWTLQRKVINKQATRKVVSNKPAELKSFLSRFEQVVATFVEFYKVLAAARADGPSLKAEMACSDSEEIDSKKDIAEAPKETAQRMVCLIVAFIIQKRIQNLTRSLLTTFLNAVDSIVYHLRRDYANSLRQELKLKYFTIRVPCQVSLALFSGWQRPVFF